MAQRQSQRSPLTKAAFGLMATVLFFALVEGLIQLAAVGLNKDWRVDPLPEQADFDVLCTHDGDRVRLCPDRGPSYEKVRAEVFTVAPKGPRIITIGESFVHGLGTQHREAWPARLEFHLNQRLAANPPIEVLNMGRCGTYASRLVPIVEAAVSLEPEILVLAMGNNEHTMTSFYTGWPARHPIAVYRTSEALAPFQLYGLLYQALGGEPKVVESFTETPLSFDDPDDRLIFAARRRPIDTSQIPDQLAGARVTAIMEKEHRLKELIFRGHLQKMIDIATDADVQVVLATVPQDLTVPPVLSGLHRGDEAEVRELIQLLEAGNVRNRDSLVDDAIAVDDRVSRFLYMKGRELMQQGEKEGALEMLRASVEWDLAPDATPAINQITRELAQTYNLVLLDFDRLAEDYLDQPQDLFLDHVHLNAKGADVVAREAANTIAPLLGS